MRDEPKIVLSRRLDILTCGLKGMQSTFFDGANTDNDDDGKSSTCARHSSYRFIAQLAKQQILFNEMLYHGFHIVQNLVRTRL